MSSLEGLGSSVWRWWNLYTERPGGKKLGQDTFNPSTRGQSRGCQEKQPGPQSKRQWCVIESGQLGAPGQQFWESPCWRPGVSARTESCFSLFLTEHLCLKATFHYVTKVRGGIWTPGHLDAWTSGGEWASWTDKLWGPRFHFRKGAGSWAARGVENNAGSLRQIRQALFTPVKGRHADRQMAPMHKPARTDTRAGWRSEGKSCNRGSRLWPQG